MSILKLVIPLTYFTKIDLKDAYYTIPVSPIHQKYAKFANNQDLYKFTCLPNGYCHEPRKFTKVLKPPLSTLTLDNITIASCLDDCINMNPSLSLRWGNTIKIINLGSQYIQNQNLILHQTRRLNSQDLSQTQ